MNEQILTDGLNQATGWLANNQALLLDYAVNIVAAVLTLIIGLFCGKKWLLKRFPACWQCAAWMSPSLIFCPAMVRHAVGCLTPDCGAGTSRRTKPHL